jgi:hypothetical protein
MAPVNSGYNSVSLCDGYFGATTGKSKNRLERLIDKLNSGEEIHKNLCLLAQRLAEGKNQSKYEK